jgi:hypothetical protein
VAVAVIAGGGENHEPAAPASVTAPLDAPTPDAGADAAAASAPPVDAAPPPPVDAAGPVDAQEIDAGRRNRTRPPADRGGDPGSARGIRDLTK